LIKLIDNFLKYNKKHPLSLAVKISLLDKENIDEAFHHFPSKERWVSLLSEQYDKSYNEWREMEDLKRTGSQSFYDSQPAPPPSEPDLSDRVYEEQKAVFEKNRVECIESIMSPEGKRWIDAIRGKLEELNLLRSENDAAEYKLAQCVEDFLRLTREIVGNMSFWETQGKSIKFWTTKTPSSIDDYRNIFKDNQLSASQQWNAIRQLAQRKLDEYDQSTEKKSPALIRLHQAIKEKDVSKLKEIISDIQPMVKNIRPTLSNNDDDL
jgi:hypothetical protein